MTPLVRLRGQADALMIDAVTARKRSEEASRSSWMPLAATPVRAGEAADAAVELAKLARAIDWRFLEEKFGAVYTDHPGRPPLPTRLMAGLAILKHTFDLSDEVVCARWVENPYYQYF